MLIGLGASCLNGTVKYNRFQFYVPIQTSVYFHARTYASKSAKMVCENHFPFVVSENRFDSVYAKGLFGGEDSIIIELLDNFQCSWHGEGKNEQNLSNFKS